MVNEGRRILVVGCGSIGRRHARICRQLGVGHVGLCDPSAEQRKTAIGEIGGAPEYGSLQEALRAGWDGVILCTPPHLHVPQAAMAVRAGCDVLTEKPLSVDSDGIADLERLAAEKRRIVMTALCFRYHAGLLRVKELVDGGALGTVVSARAYMGEYLPDCRPGVDYRTLYVAAPGVGVTLDMIHDIDFVQWIVGRPVEGVFAVTGKFSDLDMRGDDLAQMILRFAGGVVGNIHLEFFQTVRRRYSEYTGTRGTAVIEMSAWDRCTIDVYTRETGAWKREELAMERDDMFRAMDGEFLHAVGGGGKPVLDIREGTRSLSIALAAKRSSALGCLVKPEDLIA